MSQREPFDASDDAVCNKSKNTSFGEVLRKHFSRRTVVKGGLASAAGGFIASSALAGNKTFSVKSRLSCLTSVL